MEIEHSPLDLKTMGASLPSPAAEAMEDQIKEFRAASEAVMEGFVNRGPPPPYPSEKQPPQITVTMAGCTGGSSSSRIYSTSPSQQQQQQGSRLTTAGIDPELEFLLDSDPGLMEMKSKSFCDFGQQQQQPLQQQQPWYSLPSTMDQFHQEQQQQQQFDFVANPNVVERVKSQTVSSER